MQPISDIESSSDISENESIKKVLSGFSKGWNMHDVKAFSSVFAEDADFTNVMGVSKAGRNAIEEMHDPLFKTIWASSTLTITKSKTRFLKPDVAVVDAWWDLDGLKAPDGTGRAARNGLLSIIMTRHDNQWLITVMHNMDLPGSAAQKC